ncbi:hypothetical protein ACFLY9_01005 [Patescibacteria group bacterium]
MLEKKLTRAIKYLISQSPQKISKAHQYKDENCTKVAQNIEVIFPIALTLHSLGSIGRRYKSKTLTKWVKKAIGFIENQSNNFSFNYWIKSSKCFKQFPLPDDLDDTAFCLSALIKNGKDISEKYFLKILQLESKVGGPYRTWYVDPNNVNLKKWLDIDPTVNSSLLYFATLFGLKLPKTKKYLLKCLKENKINSPYYPYDLMFLFNLSKHTKQVNDTKTSNLIIRKLSKYKRLTPMEKLLHSLICVNVNLKPKYLKDILKLQKENGSLPSLPFCYDFTFRNRQTYSGSSICTTALFIELASKLVKHSTKTQKSEVVKALKGTLKQQKKIIEKELVHSKIKSKFYKLFPKERSYKALTVPVSIALDLKSKLSDSDIRILNNLSVAIFFAWLGYTLQDEIIDKQRSEEFIPTSNTLIRIGWKYYYKVIENNPSFEKYILKAFQICDTNYEWEAKHTKFDDKNVRDVLKRKWNYKYIKNRMEPYLTSLRFIPSFIGINKKNERYLYDFFVSQVTIDQLNDDAHDWREDAKLGTMTYVLSLLYSESRNSKRHETLFWNKVMPKVIDTCKKEYEKAKRALIKINPQKGILKKLLDKTYAPIQEAKIERGKVLKLLEEI